MIIQSRLADHWCGHMCIGRYNADAGRPDPPEALHNMFRAVLQYVRDVVRGNQQDWNLFLKELDPRLISYLVTFYDL
jgi:hypothetical protein